MATLQEILTNVNAYTDLEAAMPTGTELTVRTSYVNQAISDAASAYRFKEFDAVYNVFATGATVSMPSNFREMYGNPKAFLSNGTWQDIRMIEAKDKYKYDSTDYWCYQQGNPSSGYSLYVNGFASGASISFAYQKYPTSLVSPADVCELPDPEYVKQKVISYIMQSRGDERLTYVDSDAQQRLLNMIGRSQAEPRGKVNQTPRTSDYVVGE